MPDVSELMTTVREYTNQPRKQYSLLRSHASWNMLCSSMDALEDTELAISAYVRSGFPAEDGEKYLLTYGVLQALFVQQDAMTNLCAALGILCDLDPSLKVVRNIRNDAVGHPTRRRLRDVESFNMISRVTMSKKGFQLLTSFSDDRESIFTNVELLQLIEKQQECFQIALGKVVAKLREEEAQHRAMFRNDKLRDAFPPTLGYYFSKVKESTYSNIGLRFGEAHFEFILEALETLKRKLEARGTLEAYEGFNGIFEELRYPIEKLKSFFNEEPSSRLTEKDAYIFIFYVERHFDELIQMAEETDAEYQESP